MNLARKKYVIYYIFFWFLYVSSLRYRRFLKEPNIRPRFLTSNEQDLESKKVSQTSSIQKSHISKDKFSIKELFQLVMMGAGAPVLGEYKGTDESGKMLFELEANNFADTEGNSIQQKAPYFESGYEGERFEVKPPGFWENLLSGGKLQRNWEEKYGRK